MNNRCVQFFSLLIIGSFTFSLYGMEQYSTQEVPAYEKILIDAMLACHNTGGSFSYDTMHTSRCMFPDVILSSSNQSTTTNVVSGVAGVVASVVLPAVTTLVIRSASNSVSRYTFKRPQMIVNSHNGELEIEIVEKSEAEQKY